jgi:sulfate transport system substrate-binding protein
MNAEILHRHADRLPPINLFPITLLGKNWDEIYQKFFDENAIFDTIFPRKVNA